VAKPGQQRKWGRHHWHLRQQQCWTRKLNVIPGICSV
jgi:hypothetical protein